MDIRNWHKSIDGEIVVYKSWNIEQAGFVEHCFTTRRGGISAPPRDTLNLALHVEDDPACVLENRRRLALSQGFDPSAFTCAEQVHGVSVAIVKASDVGRGATRFEDSFPGADALVTDVPGVMLTLFYADCVPYISSTQSTKP